ncbi:MAG: TMEM175 family protein [Ignavibacteria bacterium]
MKTYNEIAGHRIQRVEAISDGVFAIALTLLVLDIKVPVTESIHSENELMAEFFSLAPKLLTYFLSFLTLGIFWTGQSSQFQFIEKSDRSFNWINLFFLLFVSVIPFTTAFLSEHITYKFAIGLYWLNIFLLGIMLYINWTYAEKHNFISVPPEEESDVSKAIKRRIIYASSLYTIAALLCFINTYLSIAVFIAVQLNSAIAILSKSNRQI